MTTAATPHRPQRGFSLLEMMVAIVIGMFSVLVIVQVLSGTATSRRIAVGGGDAQLNGVAAMRTLQLEIEHAGMGLQSFNISGCSLTFATGGTAVTLPSLAPVTINSTMVPAGDANTDTLLVMSGNSASPSEGDAVNSTTTANTYMVTTPDAFQVGDRLLVSPSGRASPCALQVAQVTAKTGFALTVANGTAGLPSGSIVFNLGSTPVVRAYAIRNGDLTVCDYLASNCGAAASVTPLDNAVWAPVASNLVSMRAQYARDTSGITGSVSVMDGVVDQFDQATPTAAGAIPLQCAWVRVLGVRLALVARSQQFDKNLVYRATSTGAGIPPPTWEGATPNATASSGVPLNPTVVPITLGTGWANYRYNTTQTLIPLRNAIWQGGQPSYQGGGGAC